MADYTCSWLITVITLHRPCTLIHLSTVITGNGNHQGATPNLCPPAVKDCFISTPASGGQKQQTISYCLLTNLFVWGPRISFSLWWLLPKLQLNMVKKPPCLNLFSLLRAWQCVQFLNDLSLSNHGGEHVF